MTKEEGELVGTKVTEGELVAKLPKEHLRSLFYLFSGKPDSRIRVFTDPVHITPQDILELNQCITRKLNTHHIDAKITSVKVGFVDADISEFGTWEEFKSHHWQEPECVEELVIKWDFMVDIENYKVPQRHTLLVRISTDIKPGKVIQMLASGNPDDFDQMDMLAAPAFCRVDFINAQMSKELINEVASWYKGRKEPVLIPGTYYWLKQKRQYIAEFIHQLFPLTATLIFAAGLFWVNTREYSGQIPVHVLGAYLLASLYLLSLTRRVGGILASKIYESLGQLEGSRVLFEFTSGDRKRISELSNANKKQGMKFLKTSAWALVLNIVAGVIATWLYTHS